MLLGTFLMLFLWFWCVGVMLFMAFLSAKVFPFNHHDAYLNKTWHVCNRKIPEKSFGWESKEEEEKAVNMNNVMWQLSLCKWK